MNKKYILIFLLVLSILPFLIKQGYAGCCLNVTSPSYCTNNTCNLFVDEDCSNIEDCSLVCCCYDEAPAVTTRGLCEYQGYRYVTITDENNDCSALCGAPGEEEECNYGIENIHISHSGRSLIISIDDGCPQKAINYNISRTCNGPSYLSECSHGETLIGSSNVPSLEDSTFCFDSYCTYRVEVEYEDGTTKEKSINIFTGHVECYLQPEGDAFCINDELDYMKYKPYFQEINSSLSESTSYLNFIRSNFASKFHKGYYCINYSLKTLISCDSNKGEQCIETEKAVECAKPDVCKQYNDPYGTYVNIESCENDDSCYFEPKAGTVAGLCLSVTNVKRCMDYRSKWSCEEDKAGVATSDQGCKWVVVSEELDLGFCRDPAINDCEYCKEYDFAYEDCNMLFELEDNCSYLQPCSAIHTCLDYGDNETACTGGTHVNINPDTHEIITRSNDLCGIGVCNYLNGGCHKDIDLTPNQLDCITPECEQDIYPPKITIVPKENEYGGLILQSQINFVVYDKRDYKENYKILTGDLPSGYEIYVCSPENNNCYNNHLNWKKYTTTTVTVEQLINDGILNDKDKYQTLRAFVKDPSNNVALIDEKKLHILTDLMCEEGETRLCENQNGVCMGSIQTCKDELFKPHCTYEDYQAYSKDYEIEETLCDGLDNDCDTLIDEGCECSGDETRECGPKIENEYCKKGIQSCIDGKWSDECTGATYPDTYTDCEECINKNDQSLCNGIDDDCDGSVDEGCECDKVGETRECGPDTTYGRCKKGKQICQEDHTWSECIGAIWPEEEICDPIDPNNPEESDEDCDNQVNEGCECINGMKRSCNPHPFGECFDKPGTQECIDGKWSKCTGFEEPEEEYGIKCDNIDNDCDGLVDEGCPCKDGETRDCGSHINSCEQGIQRCINGKWSDKCENAVWPLEEEICGNNEDDDCDGLIDEGCPCNNEETRECGVPSAPNNLCKPGIQKCIDGIWSDKCEGARFPQQEICDEDEIDEDCDGLTNELCECTPGQNKSCGISQGICNPGWMLCIDGKWSNECIGATLPLDREICDPLGEDEDCDGSHNEGCECIDNTERDCGIHLGACREKLGIQKCINGKWSECINYTHPQAEKCFNGIDDDCDGSVDEGCFCSEEGATRPCGLNISECEPGIQICVNHKWSNCTDAKFPQEEICDGKDNDCDGLVDEGCICKNGDTMECGTSTGNCEPGIQICVNGTWSKCIDATWPEEEICDGIDNDCDGLPDEGCNCTTGQTRPCGLNVGICTNGTQRCINGKWSDVCEGAISPQDEICDGLDNDCDGVTDEGCECIPGTEEECGTSVGECNPGRRICKEDGTWGECMNYTGPEDEICDGKDNDCDGLTDEGFDFDLDGIADCIDNDIDNDGVPKEWDEEVHTPLGCKIDVKTGKALDSDGDGICDGIDLCNENLPGCKVAGYDSQNPGCPINCSTLECARSKYCKCEKCGDCETAFSIWNCEVDYCSYCNKGKCYLDLSDSPEEKNQCKDCSTLKRCEQYETKEDCERNPCLKTNCLWLEDENYCCEDEDKDGICNKYDPCPEDKFNDYDNDGYCLKRANKRFVNNGTILGGFDCDDNNSEIHIGCGCLVDKDGDGYGEGCLWGPDCNDTDPTHNKYCPSGCRIDMDGDGYGPGCRKGPDCDDYDPNKNKPGTCIVEDKCKNGVKDENETDVDCGGMCPPCGNGKTCKENEDCKSKYCSNGVCKDKEKELCKNGIKDLFETDVDCGGMCPPCETGKKCFSNNDCKTKVCLNNTCVEPSCNDNIKNQGESDVDCGGPCKPCEINKRCHTDSDCITNNCVSGRCMKKIEEEPTQKPIAEEEKKKGLGILWILLIILLGAVAGLFGYYYYTYYIKKPETKEELKQGITPGILEKLGKPKEEQEKEKSRLKEMIMKEKERKRKEKLEQVLSKFEVKEKEEIPKEKEKKESKKEEKKESKKKPEKVEKGKEEKTSEKKEVKKTETKTKKVKKEKKETKKKESKKETKIEKKLKKISGEENEKNKTKNKDVFNELKKRIKGK